MMRIEKKSSRALKRAMATVLSLALAMSAVAVAPTADAAAKKKPKLSAKKKTLYYNGKKTFTLKVKKGKKVKKIKKTTWKTSNKKVVKISKKKKTSVKLTAKKKGSAKITATVKYTVKGSKKVKKVKLTCKVTSKKKSSGSSTTTKTNAPATKAPTTTAPAGGGQGGTQSNAPAASQPASSAAPSAEASAPAASVEPSAEASEPAASTEPSAEVSAPAASVEPSAEASAPAASAEPSAEASAPAVSAEPSAEASAPAASVEPSAEASAPAASIAPSAEASAPAVSAEPSANPASGSATVAISGSAVSGAAITLKAGETTEVSAVVTVSGCAVSGSYVWASSNAEVATVSGSGVKATIKAVKDGTAKVTVTVTTDTGVTAKGELTVVVGDGGTVPPAPSAGAESPAPSTGAESPAPSTGAESPAPSTGAESPAPSEAAESQAPAATPLVIEGTALPEGASMDSSENQGLAANKKLVTVTVNKTKLAADTEADIIVAYTFTDKDGEDLTSSHNHFAKVSKCGDYEGAVSYNLHQNADGGRGNFKMSLTAEKVNKIIADGNTEALEIEFWNGEDGFNGTFQVTSVKIGEEDAKTSVEPDPYVFTFDSTITGNYKPLVDVPLKDLLGESQWSDFEGIKVTYSYTNNVADDESKITPYMTVGGYVGSSDQGTVDQDGKELAKGNVEDKVVEITFVNASKATEPRIIIGTGGDGGSFDGTCQITKIELIPKNDSAAGSE